MIFKKIRVLKWQILSLIYKKIIIGIKFICIIIKIKILF